MSLTGMNRDTGQPVSGIEHLRQSLADILSTPIGSRRMRPEYGSNIPRMVDQPVNPGWIATVQSEAARALARWEPRIKLKRVSLISLTDGRPVFRIEGDYIGENQILDVTA